MRILLVNKFHYLKGGSEKYYFELGNLLKEKGHEVAYFSMKNPKNICTGEKEYFVEPIDLNNGSKLKALDVIYSKENYKKMQEALDDFKPDIVHLNNFQRQLSESIIEPILKRKIPIVFTAHDVQAVCPAIVMLDKEKNICEKCIGGKYNNCIKNNCIKNSKLKSVLGAIEGKYYRKRNVYTKKIDYIVTPSEFYKNKMVEDGIPEHKIESIHNFINLKDYNLKTENNDYGLYVGRLSKEKGILNLIEAFSKLQDKKLYIAGEGPEKEKIEEIIKNKNIQSNIIMLGYLKQEAVKEYIRKASFIIVPSVWYENCPYSILETQAIGKAVIGADIGGIPELVKDNENGLVYRYDDVEELKNKMENLFKNKQLTDKLANNAKKYAEDNYNKEIYYDKIMKIYKKVLKCKS